MDIQTKDGILLRGIPDGTPDEVIKARIDKIRAEGATVTESAPQKPLTNDNPNAVDKWLLENFSPQLAKAPDIQGSIPGRLIQGAARLPVGAMQLGANLVGAGDAVNPRISEIAKRTESLRGPDAGYDWAGLVGELANPAVIMALSKIPTAVTAAQRILQGAAVGGATGAMSPVTEEGNYALNKGTQIGVGTMAGAAIPGAWEGAQAVGRGVRNVVQPYLGQAGADAAAGRLANAAAGSHADEIINLLKNPQQLVPGSNPTAGQAAVPANSAEFSALQKAASERLPSSYYGPKGIEGEQNAARLAAVRTVGQTPKDLADAEAARTAAAKVNYGTAYAQAVKADPKLLALSENPYFKEALPDAVRLAEANGVNPKGQLTHFLHYVKISLDKQLNKTGDAALDTTEKAAVTRLQKDLIGWMGETNPSYEAARAAFAQASKPINQMKIGQYLEDKLIPALSEETKQRAASYANALREAPQTIKRATGSPRFDDLSKVMEPGQMQTLTGVQQDLARDATMQGLASKGMKAAQERIGNVTPEAPPTGMFSPILSVTRGAYNRLTGKASDKIMDDLAILMQNPKQLAKVMEGSKPAERRAFMDAMMKYQAYAASAAQQ